MATKEEIEQSKLKTLAKRNARLEKGEFTISRDLVKEVILYHGRDSSPTSIVGRAISELLAYLNCFDNEIIYNNFVSQLENVTGIQEYGKLIDRGHSWLRGLKQRLRAVKRGKDYKTFK